MKRLFFYTALLIVTATSVFATETPATLLPVNQNGSFKVIGLQQSTVKSGYTTFANAKVYANEEYKILMVQNSVNKDETDVYIAAIGDQLWTSIGTVCDSFTNVYVEKITAGGWDLTLSSPICKHTYVKKMQPFQESFVEVK